MKNVWRRLCAVALAAVLATQGMGAYAGAPGPGGAVVPQNNREAALLQMIQQLQDRIDQLEQKVDKVEEVAEDSAEVSIRQSTLEAKVDELAEDDGVLYGDNDFRVYWSSGLRMESGNGDFKLRIGGRIQNDWAWYDDDESLWPIAGGDLEDGTEFRRARIYLQGSIYDNINYKAQYDFETGDADFKDVYIEYDGLPGLGALRVGHFKEPFSLNELTSSKYLMFMERALPNAFVPGRNTGAMLHNTAFDERMTWAAGIFRETNDYGDGQDDGGYNFTARVTGLPWYEEDGRKLLHLGLGFSHRNVDGDLRFRQRPESHDTDRYISTDNMPVDDYNLYGAEAALVYGPFSVQGEYMLADVDRTQVGFFGGAEDPEFDGWYVQASYFLTGEHRVYETDSASFGRVKPNRNFGFGPDGGPGAWELALRYSTLDLTDSDIWGGEQDNITAGVKWYLNPNTRVLFDYINADIDRRFLGNNTWFPVTSGGDINIFQTRFQVDF